MGSFSWCYCDLGNIPLNKNGYPKKRYRMRYCRPGSVLFPAEFGGKLAQIDVQEYEDYGRFTEGGKTSDIYALVADWNRKYLSEHPGHEIPSRKKRVSEYSWYKYYSDLSLGKEEVLKRWEEDLNKNARPDAFYFTEWRQIGIDIACYNEDNAALPYPIKIARNRDSVYEACPPSINDPLQGFD